MAAPPAAAPAVPPCAAPADGPLGAPPLGVCAAAPAAASAPGSPSISSSVPAMPSASSSESTAGSTASWWRKKSIAAQRPAGSADVGKGDGAAERQAGSAAVGNRNATPASHAAAANKLQDAVSLCSCRPTQQHTHTCHSQRRVGKHGAPLLQAGIALKVVQAAGSQLMPVGIPVQHRHLGIPAGMVGGAKTTVNVSEAVGRPCPTLGMVHCRHGSAAAWPANRHPPSCTTSKANTCLKVSSRASLWPGARPRSTATLSATPNSWQLESSSKDMPASLPPPVLPTAAAAGVAGAVAAAAALPNIRAVYTSSWLLRRTTKSGWHAALPPHCAAGGPCVSHAAAHCVTAVGGCTCNRAARQSCEQCDRCAAVAANAAANAAAAHLGANRRLLLRHRGGTQRRCVIGSSVESSEASRDESQLRWAT